MLFEQLKQLQPIDSRLGLFLEGDTDEVGHDDYWSAKLDVELHDLMESRCENTKEFLLWLFTEGKSGAVISIRELESYNFFTFTLYPKDYRRDDERPSHVFTVMRDEEYVLCDSYANHYKLRLQSLTVSEFMKLLRTIIRFLATPSSKRWKKITGVEELFEASSYALELIGYNADLNIDIALRRKELYRKALHLFEDPSPRNVYRDYAMSLVFGEDLDEVKQQVL